MALKCNIAPYFFRLMFSVMVTVWFYIMKIGAIGNRPYSWKLAEQQLASFCKSLNMEALHI